VKESIKELSEDTLEFTYLVSGTDDGECGIFTDNVLRIGVWNGCTTGGDSDDGAPGARSYLKVLEASADE